MGQFLIVSKADRLADYCQIAQSYQVGFEYNDFYDPVVLSDEERLDGIWQQYDACRKPSICTMHGAFLDVTVFSADPKIREVSELRMLQSIQQAERGKVSGVVFHTNINPFLNDSSYIQNAVSMTGDFVEKLLLQFPDLSIYMENMFDDDPDMLRMLSERLIKYPNYGVCLDYAHASLSRTKIDIWVEALAPYVRHVHINDHDGKHDLHLAVGSGVTDWKKFAVFYEKYFSSLTVLVEKTRPDWQKQSLDYLMRLGGK